MQVVEALTANGCCTVRVRAHALPRPMAALLEDSADILRHTLMRGDPATTQTTTSSQPNVPSQEAVSAAIPAGSNGLHIKVPAELPSAADDLGAVSNGNASDLPAAAPQVDGGQAQSSATPAAAHANGNMGEHQQHEDGADEIRRRSHGDATTSSAAHAEQGEDRNHLHSHIS